MEVAGVYCMYDGPRSPCTQTFGLGLFGMPEAADLERIEAFFRERAAPVHHEVSPLAERELLGTLVERGYRPIELTNAMFLPLGGLVTPAGEGGQVRVRLAREDEREIWARTAVEGWREVGEFSDLMTGLMGALAGRAGALSFLGGLDGRPVATGALFVHDDVALLAGASTVPEWRKRGAQRALLEARFEHAAQAGCDLAMIVVEPGSISQRNAERQGFRIAYTRTKWALG
jgi:GNAT superfamily N-acetyltransferase